jgi:hypothetical protein
VIAVLRGAIRGPQAGGVDQILDRDDEPAQPAGGLGRRLVSGPVVERDERAESRIDEVGNA